MTSALSWKGFAPGRGEWLGNHTDYNDGLVLGFGLDCGTTVTGRARSDGKLVLLAHDLGRRCTVDLNALAPQSDQAWANYVLGVVAAFLARGTSGPGLDLEIRSNVPMGAGLSSSAALECATARLLQQAWGTDFSELELARIGQWAEHEFAGVRCGLLDQVTSLFARRDQAVFFDCRSLAVERVPLSSEVRFVIIPSGVRHDLSDGAYNQRRQECEEAARVLRLNKLGEADGATLEKARERGSLAGAPLRRAQHIVGEIARVDQAVGALRAGNLAAVGRAMSESHESSRTLFENSCPELDFLVEVAQQSPGCLGARLTGGGFGGAILALVGADDLEDFSAKFLTSVESSWGRQPQLLVTRAGGPVD